MSEANLEGLEALNLPKQAQISADRVAHQIIPTELFDPDTQGGRLLAALGFSPNGESNVVLTEEAYRDIYERAHHQLMNHVGRTNADLPDGVNIWPFVIVPEECWQSPFGAFLLKQLKLTPFAAWNVLILPKDERSAMELGIRSHPGPMGAPTAEWVTGLVGKLAARVRTVNDDLMMKMQAGERPDFTLSLDVDERARGDMHKLAAFIARKALGDETVVRSRDLFPLTALA